jgi:plastocyanin
MIVVGRSMLPRPLLMTLGIVLVACARPTSSASPPPSAAPSPVASPSPSASPAQAASPSPAESPNTAPARPSGGAPILSPGQPSGGAETLSVIARDLSFTPRELSATSGATITVSLQNAGRIAHNITIDELNLRVVASPGRDGSATIGPVAPGTYTFYCSISGHRQAGMEGTLTVR